ncbi:DUF4190 domain-containing protein [Alteribacter natronophilus]|uniref:DUF4190 domain-containing protein n=1 Tax=Alteribacter natronophilus TaxID=2583810 RepID=UPI00110EA7AF|nr:DUF4190 domain-containing protein [Alteribacter natronophilus]TMW72752.1 DUF4190 domain-containing protein [Alteribacter natronophilus]
MDTAANKKTNTKAAVGLTAGIISLLIPGLGIVFAVTAIVFSILGRKEMNRLAESGHGLATAGLVCGIAAIVINVFLVLIGVFNLYMGPTL